MSESNKYVPPKVWTWDSENGGEWAKINRPINRFTMEVKRQMDVLDKELSKHQYLGGGEYSISDMATWPWYGNLVLGEAYGAGEFLQVESYKNLRRWANEILQRPAVLRGLKVNCTWGELSNQLHERHDATDFELKTQDKLMTPSAT